MSYLLRSEEMSLVQLFLQSDFSYNCVSELGELGLVQFKDLNKNATSYQRKFVNEIRRCDEMERILRYINDLVRKNGFDIPDGEEVGTPLPKDMVELENNFQRLEEQLVVINENAELLLNDYTEMIQMRETVDFVQTFLDEGLSSQAKVHLLEAKQGLSGPIVDGELYKNERSQTITSIDVEMKGLKQHNELKYIAGVIQRSNSAAFERVLWRWCRGNVFIRNCDFPQIDEQYVENTDSKTIFIVFFFGDELNARVRKICDGFHVSVYNCPETSELRAEMKINLKNRLLEMASVLKNSVQHRDSILSTSAKSLDTWSIQVAKMKAVFSTLDRFNFDITQRCLIAECWVPKDKLLTVRLTLSNAAKISGSSVEPIVNVMETESTPPTYNRTNKFTKAFQNIVDAYGICTYREVNPAPWTIITFPFIFAVMFGDAGHGVIMLLSALALIIFEQRIAAAKITDEIFNTFYSGRYVILLMGLFSIYTGIVYNEIYSRSIDIFGSSWKNPYVFSTLEGKSDKYLLDLPPGYAFEHEKGPYPFGLDPVWNIAINKLNYQNPMKMKMSVIIGISQMTFGLSLAIVNHFYFKSAVDIIFVWIPELLFLTCIFIYLCLQIIIKWIFFYVWPARIFGFFYPSSNCAPSLLIGLINMFMMKQRKPGFVKMTPECINILNDCPGELIKSCDGAAENCTSYSDCGLQQWYPHQSEVELILLLIAVISIPVMLLVKPFIMKYRASRGLKVTSAHGGGPDDEEEAEFSFGDTLVYQSIHTIEFCLGCISHTASYLRLWALSLAHAELSEVLWTMVYDIAFGFSGWAGCIIQWAIFWVFALLTIAILILMEGLSAFLHALRLHWVEFQSKFFGGAGYLFEPFSFKTILEPSD